LDILQQELNTETIDVDTSFFQFGINSLTMMKISARLKSEFRVNVDIGTLFECKNISTLAKIIEQKEVIFEENIYPFVGADVKRMHDKFPLTEIQASYLLGREEGYELGNISTHVYIELKTQLDIPRINRGLKKLINKHAMMRAIFIENQQRILEKVPEYIIECEELHGLTKSEIEERLLSERNRMSHHVFKPEKWPLFEFKAIKCDDVSHYLLIGLDMLIIDASGIDSLATELMEFYKDEEREVEQIDFSFRDYVLAYKEFKNSAVYENDKRYWLKKLNDFPAAPNLPTKVDISKIETPVFKRVQKLIDLERWEKLKNEAMLHQVTPSSLLCTIYLEILAFWSNQPKLAINLTIVNRYPFHPEVDKLLGDFTSVIPVDADFSQNELFWNKVKIVQNMIMAGLEHRHYDGVEFIRELASANNYVNKAVIPVVFTSLLANEVWGKWNKIGELNYIITQTSQVYLDYQASEMDGQLLINWDYISDLLDDKMVQDMFDQYIDRLTRISDSSIELDNVMISHHDLMKIQQYNDTNEEIKSALLHQLFEEQVERNADQLAIINGDHRMIYRELNEKANQVARKLIELGVQDNELIGVSAARCIESIANIMGILKAGGAYVPIDPQYPQERIKYILDHSQCKMMLEPDFYTTHQLDAYASDNLQRDASVDQTAYVIYTSGSTGKPKGVVITHRAVANTILDINRKFNVNEKDRILGISSMCFDLSVYDIFGALTAGATLIQIPDQRDVIDIYETIEKYEVTIWNSVPAIMDMILHNMQGRSTYEEVEHAEQEMEEASQVVVRREKYYWSPAVSWDEEFYLDGYVYVDSEMLTLFPHFYFFMQKGCYLEEIYTEFPNMPKNKLKSFVQELLEQRVLVSTILNPHEVFRSQEKLFDNPYNEDILYNPQSYGKFKKKQLTRKFQGATGEKVPLAQPYPFPSYLQERKSHRKFNENEKIPLVYISQLLSVFRQRELDHHIQYYYPSAGGLYPIDIFLYVKEDRIEQLRKGIYYYNPIDNSLSLVNGDCVITEDAHFYTNKSIFNSSATSIYMIYNAEATMPKYGGSGYLYACIDTGIMISTMVHVAEMLNIGTCSIGEMEFETIKDQFKLNHKQVLIHTVELGFKEDIDIKKTGFHVNLIDKEAIETISVTDAKQTIKTQMQARLNKVGRAEIMNERTNNSVLRLVLLSGDWIPLSLPQKIKNYFVNADVISLGGATEASIWSIYYPIGEVTSTWKSVPYGKPLANQKFYVLNYQGNLCPIGVSGELYISGVGLAKEYANDPDKTNQSFIEHPVFGKLYKTGDHGRMLEKGVIEFLGRKDQQVKIRGHRIELGEIENCLIAHPEIQNVTVVDYTEKNGKKYLCAYIVSEKNIEPKELREHVIRELPEYMLPAFFVQIKNIPLTVNGKVDRKSLPKPNVSNPAHKEQLKPSNELEQVIWSIWKKIIKKDEISMNDNFFDIGGDSMLLAHVHSELEKLYPKMLRVTDLFTSTSISRLAESLANKIKITKKRLDLHAVKLPLEYFSGHGNVAEYTVFMYTMDVKSTNQLKNLAVMQSISMEELLTSFYMYILNQVSGENRIGIHTMIDRRNTLYSIEVDFGNFTQFDQLFEEVKGRASSDPFMIQDIALMDKQRVDLSIVPAIMRKNLCPANMNLTEFYDFLLVLEQSNHELHLVCEYNGSKLKADKARSLFNDYVKLIKAYLKRV
jgi:SagB-type dehydrogenase family enzyme